MKNFRPLLRGTKEYSKIHQIQTVIANSFGQGVVALLTGRVMAYYDYQNRVIRHVQCLLKLPHISVSKQCDYCRTFRDNFLRKHLGRLLNQQESQFEVRCDIHSHANYRYLTTLEKIQRMNNIHNFVCLRRCGVYTNNTIYDV